MTIENNPSARKRKNSSSNIKQIALVLASITPVGCLCAMLIGLGIAWSVYPTRYTNSNLSELSTEHADEVVIMAAADYAQYQDLARVTETLAQLKVANPPQYVSLVAERLIRQHRGPITEDIQNVVKLADALNVSTAAMIAYISSPTPVPTATPLPTNTPTATPVILPTDTPIAQVSSLSNEAASASEASEAATRVAAATTESTPTETPTLEPTATETDVPAEPTDTPVPPTDTPVPEPTATTVPDVDFVIKKQRLYSKAENGGCIGMHTIFIEVLDAQGNPIKGVQLGDEWGNAGPVSGHKGDDKPGHAEWDLYKNGGFKVSVKNDPTAGRPVTSQTSELLSSDDWKIGIPRLMEAGYCSDEGACRRDWNSGVAGEGANSLCWGHYSWELVFQRTW